MALSQQDIERVVAEVIARLRQAGVAIERADANQVGIPGAPPQNVTYTLTDHVVSLRALEGRLENLQRLVVGSRAVVTPSARDELRAHGVTLVRSEQVHAT